MPGPLTASEIEALSRLPHGALPRDIGAYLTRKREVPALRDDEDEVTTPAMPRGAEAFGRFQLFNRIGTGGMAEVFLARQTGAAGFAKLVVVKKILPQLATDQSFVKMFLQEAQLASRIAHPNVVQIYDLGEMAGSYFIAMEYVRGWDLSTLLNHAAQVDHPMPAHVAAYVASCICAGLNAAHTSVDELGMISPIIHRDVSPHNVLVSFDGLVKLADFGVAKAVNSDRTPTTGIKGKLAYMAPEQLNPGSRPLDGRLDIFPTGVVLFQMLTFRHPFQGETEFLTLKAVLESEPPRPSALRADLPPELDAIVALALARDVGHRYQKASDMQHDLEKFVARRAAAAGQAELAGWIKGLLRKTLNSAQPLEVPQSPTLSLAGQA
jgi:serine/threonine-protein kinase